MHPVNESAVAPPPSAAPPHPAYWRQALALAVVLLAALSWLLARLNFLPMYMGLFFHLVAGALVGAVCFRVARRGRPYATPSILRGIVLVAAVSAGTSAAWEYRYFAATVGQQPRFPEARNAAVAANRQPNEIEARACRAFLEVMRAKYPPGGPLGYARWAISGAPMQITLDGSSETIEPPGGAMWAVRTLLGAILVGAGLWSSFESLRSPVAVSNVIAPGEEAPDQD